jgi:hypothetical protein
MKNYSNIEKSAFKRGAYIGYCKGGVYLITRSNSSFGNWHAANRDNWNDQLFAFGLSNLSDKLTQHTPIQKVTV